VTTDAELIGWSVAGDDSAFIEVVRRHAPAVSAYLARELAADRLKTSLVRFGSVRSVLERPMTDRIRTLAVAVRHCSSHAMALLANSAQRRPGAGYDDDAGALRSWPVVDDRIDGATVMRRAW